MALYHLVINTRGVSVQRLFPTFAFECCCLDNQTNIHSIFPSRNYICAIAPSPEKMRVEEADSQDVCKLNSCIINFELRKSVMLVWFNVVIIIP